MTSRLPIVPLRNLVRHVERVEAVVPDKNYRQIGVKLWGKGAYERESVRGAETKYEFFNIVRQGDIIVNKIWACNGSVAVVPESLAGCYCSGEFPIFSPDPLLLDPRWFHYYTMTSELWAQCAAKSRGTSGKTRIRPEEFLEVRVPLPPLPEQWRIAARVEAAAATVSQVQRLTAGIAADTRATALRAYSEIICGAEHLPMAEVAPLVRRPIDVDSEAEYHEIGIRSFGNGTFQKPVTPGGALGTKRIFRIEAGDLLFNIVFAWEGAVAVASSVDGGRCGSHRFLTCVADPERALARYLCFHFLTEAGLRELGEASPGGAGRNRTLGLKALENIAVPVPPLKKQSWFVRLLERFDEVERLQRDNGLALDRLLPSVLHRAFEGDL